MALLKDACWDKVYICVQKNKSKKKELVRLKTLETYLQ